MVAGAERYGAKVVQSKPHPYLIEAAQIQAEYQAHYQTQGHQNINLRFDEYAKVMGSISIKEICAETWAWQVNDSPEALWTEFFKCWRQSYGHWQVAIKKHKYFGYGYAKGKNNIWYGVIITAD